MTYTTKIKNICGKALETQLIEVSEPCMNLRLDAETRKPGYYIETDKSGLYAVLCKVEHIGGKQIETYYNIFPF